MLPPAGPGATGAGLDSVENFAPSPRLKTERSRPRAASWLWDPAVSFDVSASSNGSASDLPREASGLAPAEPQHLCDCQFRAPSGGVSAVEGASEGVRTPLFGGTSTPALPPWPTAPEELPMNFSRGSSPVDPPAWTVSTRRDPEIQSPTCRATCAPARETGASVPGACNPPALPMSGPATIVVQKSQAEWMYGATSPAGFQALQVVAGPFCGPTACSPGREAVAHWGQTARWGQVGAPGEAGMVLPSYEALGGTGPQARQKQAQAGGLELLQWEETLLRAQELQAQGRELQLEGEELQCRCEEERARAGCGGEYDTRAALQPGGSEHLRWEETLLRAQELQAQGRELQLEGEELQCRCEEERARAGVWSEYDTSAEPPAAVDLGALVPVAAEEDEGVGHRSQQEVLEQDEWWQQVEASAAVIAAVGEASTTQSDAPSMAAPAHAHPPAAEQPAGDWAPATSPASACAAALAADLAPRAAGALADAHAQVGALRAQVFAQRRELELHRCRLEEQHGRLGDQQRLIAEQWGRIAELESRLNTALGRFTAPGSPPAASADAGGRGGETSDSAPALARGASAPALAGRGREASVDSDPGGAELLLEEEMAAGLTLGLAGEIPSGEPARTPPPAGAPAPLPARDAPSVERVLFSTRLGLSPQWRDTQLAASPRGGTRKQPVSFQQPREIEHEIEPQDQGQLPSPQPPLPPQSPRPPLPPQSPRPPQSPQSPQPPLPQSSQLSVPPLPPQPPLPPLPTQPPLPPEGRLRQPPPLPAQPPLPPERPLRQQPPLPPQPPLPQSPPAQQSPHMHFPRSPPAPPQAPLPLLSQGQQWLHVPESAPPPIPPQPPSFVPPQSTLSVPPSTSQRSPRPQPVRPDRPELEPNAPGQAAAPRPPGSPLRHGTSSSTRGLWSPSARAPPSPLSHTPSHIPMPPLPPLLEMECASREPSPPSYPQTSRVPTDGPAATCPLPDPPAADSIPSPPIITRGFASGSMVDKEVQPAHPPPVGHAAPARVSPLSVPAPPTLHALWSPAVHVLSTSLPPWMHARALSDGSGTGVETEGHVHTERHASLHSPRPPDHAQAALPVSPSGAGARNGAHAVASPSLDAAIPSPEGTISHAPTQAGIPRHLPRSLPVDLATAARFGEGRSNHHGHGAASQPAGAADLAPSASNTEAEQRAARAPLELDWPDLHLAGRPVAVPPAHLPPRTKEPGRSAWVTAGAQEEGVSERMARLTNLLSAHGRDPHIPPEPREQAWTPAHAAPSPSSLQADLLPSCAVSTLRQKPRPPPLELQRSGSPDVITAGAPALPPAALTTAASDPPVDGTAPGACAAASGGAGAMCASGGRGVGRCTGDEDPLLAIRRLRMALDLGAHSQPSPRQPQRERVVNVLSVLVGAPGVDHRLPDSTLSAVSAAAWGGLPTAAVAASAAAPAGSDAAPWPRQNSAQQTSAALDRVQLFLAGVGAAKASAASAPVARDPASQPVPACLADDPFARLNRIVERQRTQNAQPPHQASPPPHSPRTAWAVDFGQASRPPSSLASGVSPQTILDTHLSSDALRRVGQLAFHESCSPQSPPPTDCVRSPQGCSVSTQPMTARVCPTVAVPPKTDGVHSRLPSALPATPFARVARNLAHLHAELARPEARLASGRGLV